MIDPVALRDTVTVIYKTETGDADAYGNPTMETVSETEIQAIIWPSGIPDELLIQRDTRMNIYNLIIRPDVTIDGLSAVRWNGIEMEVMGEPQLFMARHAPHHYEIKLRRIEG